MYAVKLLFSQYNPELALNGTLTLQEPRLAIIILLAST